MTWYSWKRAVQVSIEFTGSIWQRLSISSNCRRSERAVRDRRTLAVRVSHLAVEGSVRRNEERMPRAVHPPSQLQACIHRSSTKHTPKGLSEFLDVADADVRLLHGGTARCAGLI